MRWWPISQRRMDRVALHIIIFLGVGQAAVLLELQSGRIKRVEDPRPTEVVAEEALAVPVALDQ